MLKPLWWVLFILLQILFIVSGLAIIYWTMNTWDENRKLDAIFGAGMGSYAFLFAWRTIRRWALQNMSVWRRDRDGNGFDAPVMPNQL